MDGVLVSMWLIFEDVLVDTFQRYSWHRCDAESSKRISQYWQPQHLLRRVPS